MDQYSRRLLLML